MPDTPFPESPSDDADPFDSLLSGGWVSEPTVREPSAAERERDALTLQKKFHREGRRTRRRNRLRSAKKSLKPYVIPMIFVAILATFLYAQYAGNESIPVPTVADIKKIRVVEVVTSDRKDEAPFIDEIRKHVNGMQDWLAVETDGSRMRISYDSDRKAKVERVIIEASASSMLNQPDIAQRFTEELTIAGIDIGNDEALLVFTRLQPTLQVCGQTSGRTAVVFPFACAATSSEYSPRTELIAAHELIHVLGAVEGCAPHATGSRHVSDNTSDLMFEPTPDRPRANVQHLDPGNDDYYAHGRKNCLDLKDLPIWVKRQL